MNHLHHHHHHHHHTLVPESDLLLHSHLTSISALPYLHLIFSHCAFQEFCDSTDGGTVHQPNNLRDVFWKNAGMVGSICAKKLMHALNTLFSGEISFIFLQELQTFDLLMTCMYIYFCACFYVRKNMCPLRM